MARKFKPADKPTTPMQYYGYALLMAVASVGAYFYIDNAEQQADGTIRLPVILFPVYDYLGKVGISAAIALFAVLAIVSGILASRDKGTAPTDPNPASDAGTAAR